MMPLIGHLRTAKECFDALTNLYEKKAPTQKRILKKQLRTLKMGKDDTIATFFSKIAQTKDQLIAIGVPVDDDDLVQTTIAGLSAAWGVFLASVNGRESQPNFERLWHDCLEEEGRLNNRNDYPILQDHALAAKTKKWKKFPKSKGKGKKPKGKLSHLNPHLSKVKCFNCNRLGHYAKDCRSPPSQQRRKGRFKASVATEEAKPQEEPQRRQTRATTKEQEPQKEYYLISALSGTITKSEEIWLIDSGASKHMIGVKHNLANYEDKKFKVKVELGDDDTYDIKGFGSTSFQFLSAAIQAPQGALGGLRPASSETASQEGQKLESAKSLMKEEQQLERTGSDVGGTSLYSKAVDDDAKGHVGADHLPITEGVSQEIWNLRPGIAPGLKFGGTGNSPDLPWVTTSGIGPNGKTISGVMYRYNRNQVKIVCACHGRHMSPSEFVQHAGGADTSNPDNNVVVNSFSNGNHTSAQG